MFIGSSSNCSGCSHSHPSTRLSTLEADEKGRPEGCSAAFEPVCPSLLVPVRAGGRSSRGPTHTSAAVAMLDALLLLRQQQQHEHGRAAAQQRCCSPMPLVVPLPYPKMFRNQVQLHGDVLSYPAGPPGTCDVQDVPTLTQLVATRGFQGLLQQVLQRWRRAYGGGGRGLMDAWGCDSTDMEDAGELLHETWNNFEGGDQGD